MSQFRAFVMTLTLLVLFGFSAGQSDTPCEARTCSGQRDRCTADHVRRGLPNPIACANAYFTCMRDGTWGGGHGKNCGRMQKR
jgi:hypothetical protein